MNRKNLAGILISVMISVLLAALDSTIVGTAMPRIIGELHGMERYSWPFTAYMLFSTLAIVVFGKLSDLYGRKRIFLFGILFFLFSSALCGLSRSMLQLIVFRGLQGIGGGVIVSSAFIIIADLFSPRERGKYMGLVASMFGLASLLGPSAGGLITDHLSWRWVFYVNLPLGGIAFIVIVLLLPYLPPVAKGRRVDYGGAFFFLSTLLPLFLAFTLAGTEHQWLSGRPDHLLASALGRHVPALHAYGAQGGGAYHPVHHVQKPRIQSFCDCHVLVECRHVLRGYLRTSIRPGGSWSERYAIWNGDDAHDARPYPFSNRQRPDYFQNRALQDFCSG